MIDEGEKSLNWVPWLKLVRDVEIAMAYPPCINVGPRYLSLAVVERVEVVSSPVHYRGVTNLASIDQIGGGDCVDGSVEVY